MSKIVHNSGPGHGFRRTTLSVLIPAFNNDCSPLVADLVAQAEKLEDVDWEICVAEDGSTDKESIAANSRISQWPHCRHLIRQENVGRSRIRNWLGREARYDWLLFIDSHMRVGKEDFLMTYLTCSEADVVDGDYVIAADAKRWNDSIRYHYEKACEAQHTPEARRKQPYAGFHTANFLIRRELFIKNPFQESFSEYGYEDVLFGARLEQLQTDILHIDNPVEFRYFESNVRFLEKTEAAMRSLSDHQAHMGRHSRMLHTYNRLKTCKLNQLVAMLYKWRGASWRKRLAKDKKSPLLLFHVYRLSYFCQYQIGKKRQHPDNTNNYRYSN